MRTIKKLVMATVLSSALLAPVAQSAGSEDAAAAADGGAAPAPDATSLVPTTSSWGTSAWGAGRPLAFATGAVAGYQTYKRFFPNNHFAVDTAVGLTMAGLAYSGNETAASDEVSLESFKQKVAVAAPHVVAGSAAFALAFPAESVFAIDTRFSGYNLRTAGLYVGTLAAINYYWQKS